MIQPEVSPSVTMIQPVMSLVRCEFPHQTIRAPRPQVNLGCQHSAPFIPSNAVGFCIAYPQVGRYFFLPQDIDIKLKFRKIM